MIRAAIIFILCCVLPQAIGLPGIPQAGTERLLFEKPENFQKTIAWHNSAPPVWHDVTVTSSQGGSKTGKVTIPAASEIFAYDLDGNLTTDGLWTYTWDAENRLKEMTSSTALPSAARKKLEFKYDFLGRRVKKAVSTWNGSGWTLSSDTLFIYDGWNLIAEVNALNNALVRSYMWGLEIDGSLGEAGGVGGLLKVTDHTSSSDHFAGYDGNGNLVLLVNALGGAITAQYEYSPFGEIIRSTGTFAEANPLRFSTKYQDRESDQLYYGYRFLNPSTGRWLNRDPLGEDGGLNLYGFCASNPINFIDSLGHDFNLASTLVTVGNITRTVVSLGVRVWNAYDRVQTAVDGFNVMQEIAGSVDDGLDSDDFMFAMQAGGDFLEERLQNRLINGGLKSVARVAGAVIGAAKSGIQSIGSGRLRFGKFEVRAVRSLDHMSEAELRDMLKNGTAGRTKAGDTIHLHHHKQNPDGPIVEIPKPFHKNPGNKKQHPYGTTPGGGLDPDERADFGAWRKQYWKARAAEELAARGLL